MIDRALLEQRIAELTQAVASKQADVDRTIGALGECKSMLAYLSAQESAERQQVGEPAGQFIAAKVPEAVV